MSYFKQITISAVAAFFIGMWPQSLIASSYNVNPLVSNQPFLAPNTDPNLVNAWGLFFAPNGNFWVADNGSSLSTLYQPNGTIVPFVINVMINPTGAARNPGPNFLVGTMPHMHPASFVFASESGKILGFNSTVDPLNAVVAADASSSGAVYKGLDFVKHRCGAQSLWVADFHNAVIDIYGGSFNYVKSIRDYWIPDGFAPFNIRFLNNWVYVAYAKQLPPANHDDDPGVGNGYVDVFSPCGSLIKRLISGGNLNSPWGLAIAPNTFGDFSGALLVGNFGDGFINAYDSQTGVFLGELTDPSGNPIQIDGLWALVFDSNGTLYFSSGPNGETNGLVGTITLVP
ncbi:MAG: TIGR03118 family protein [Chlamydiales bacterium]|nr:TIGR03118 family protein [Chlamydiales bacterium]